MVRTVETIGVEAIAEAGDGVREAEEEGDVAEAETDDEACPPKTCSETREEPLWGQSAMRFFERP